MVRDLGRRVVITGMGTVNPLGQTVDDTWDGLVAGRSGIGPITRFDSSIFPVRIAGEVKDFDGAELFGKRRARHLDRFTQFALAATRQAIGDCKLELEDTDRRRIGVVYGTGVGGIGNLEDGIRILIGRGPEWVSPYTCPTMLTNIAAGEIAMENGLLGPNFCTVTACSAGAHAIGCGIDQIRLGRAEVMVCGGSEAGVTPVGLAGFSAMKALSSRNDEPERASRPFDAGRDGFVLAEGAATVVIEDRDFALERGAPILAEIVGFGASADAFHLTQPHPEGDGAVLAMQEALSEAGLVPGDIGYINAHGTSTVPNDRTESVAIRRLFPDGVPMSSTKSMTGHLLGAASALEAVICVRVLQTGKMPPTINYESPDPACELDVIPNQARQGDVRYAMSNSFGFGGHNATLIFGRP